MCTSSVPSPKAFITPMNPVTEVGIGVRRTLKSTSPWSIVLVFMLGILYFVFWAATASRRGSSPLSTGTVGIAEDPQTVLYPRDADRDTDSD